MITPDTNDVRQVLAGLIESRAASDEADGGTIAVARHLYDDLSRVLVPLVSQPGFDALVGRALQLARRESGITELPGSGSGDSEPFVQVAFWLDGQSEGDGAGAAAAMFAALASVLVTLIGEPLTTRYLRKAWPDGFADGHTEGTDV